MQEQGTPQTHSGSHTQTHKHSHTHQVLQGLAKGPDQTQLVLLRTSNQWRGWVCVVKYSQTDGQTIAGTRTQSSSCFNATTAPQRHSPRTRCLFPECKSNAYIYEFAHCNFVAGRKGEREKKWGKNFVFLFQLRLKIYEAIAEFCCVFLCCNKVMW